MLGVPLAQIGAVLNDASANIAEKDLNTLNQLLPVEIWKENYRPSFADKIKFNNSFNVNWLNQNKVLFLKTWANILKTNFPIYVKAYICHTYGLWNIIPYFSNVDYTQSYFTKINNNTKDDSYWGKFCSQNGLENKSIFPASINKQFQCFFESAFKVNLLMSPGIMFWCVLSCEVMLITKKLFRMCLSFLPIILIWLTMMIATPASFIYRYSFYLILTLPIICIVRMKEFTESR